MKNWKSSRKLFFPPVTWKCNAIYWNHYNRSYLQRLLYNLSSKLSSLIGIIKIFPSPTPFKKIKFLKHLDCLKKFSRAQSSVGVREMKILTFLKASSTICVQKSEINFSIPLNYGKIGFKDFSIFPGNFSLTTLVINQ